MQKKSPFKDHAAFHKLVKEAVAAINGSQVESYSEWPFLKYSLPSMVRSMVSQGGQDTLLGVYYVSCLHADDGDADNDYGDYITSYFNRLPINS